MKRMILLLAAVTLLAMVFCGCERGNGAQHTNPPKPTANVSASPSPATPSPSAAPTPDVTSTPDVTMKPDETPSIPSATEAPTAVPGGNGDTGTESGGEVPQPRRGGLM